MFANHIDAREGMRKETFDMKFRYDLMICFFCCGMSWGCTRYQVHVTTYLSPEVEFPASGSDSRIAIVAECEPDEPFLETEVARKIGAFLSLEGYSIGTMENSDFVLFAQFGVDSGQTATGVAPVYQPGGTATTNVYTSNGQWATATTQMPGKTTYVPYSYTYYTRDMVKCCGWSSDQAATFLTPSAN
jgi:hypothetical protein